MTGVPHFILSIGLAPPGGGGAGEGASFAPLATFPVPGAQDEEVFAAVLRKLIAKAVEAVDPMGLTVNAKL